MSRDFSGYDCVEFGPSGHNGGVFPALVKYLRSQSSPDDVVLLWGSVAGVNYLADRAALGPFGFVSRSSIQRTASSGAATATSS